MITQDDLNEVVSDDEQVQQAPDYFAPDSDDEEGDISVLGQPLKQTIEADEVEDKRKTMIAAKPDGFYCDHVLKIGFKCCSAQNAVYKINFSKIEAAKIYNRYLNEGEKYKNKFDLLKKHELFALGLIVNTDEFDSKLVWAKYCKIIISKNESFYIRFAVPFEEYIKYYHSPNGQTMTNSLSNIEWEMEDLIFWE